MEDTNWARGPCTVATACVSGNEAANEIEKICVVYIEESMSSYAPLFAFAARKGGDPPDWEICWKEGSDREEQR